MGGENPKDDEDRFERYDLPGAEEGGISESESGSRSGEVMGMKMPFPRNDRQIPDLGLGAVLAITGMVVGVTVQVLVFVLIEFSPVEVPESISNVALLTSLFVGLGLTAAAYLTVTDREFSFIRLRFPSLKDIGFAVAGVLTMFVALIAIGIIVDTLGADAAEHGTVETIQKDPTLALYMAALSIIAIGPAEETLFRGVIQTRLKESFSLWGAIVSTNVIFALVHIPAYGGLNSGAQELATTLVILFTISLVFGWLYERTNNLFVPMFTHGLYNSILFTFVYISTQYADQLEDLEAEAASLLFLFL